MNSLPLDTWIRLIDWMAIGTAEAGREFGTRLLEAPRPFAERTSISAAIDFSLELSE